MSTGKQDEFVQDLMQLLEDGREQEFEELLEGLHPADAAELLEFLEGADKVRFFSLLEPKFAAEVLAALPDYSQERLISDLPMELLSRAVDEMDSDDATDIVASLSHEDASSILATIDDEDSEEINRLLKYEDDTAGGLMQLEMVMALEDDTVAEVIEKIRAKRNEVQDLNYVFVVSNGQKLSGQVDLQTLVLSDSETRMKELVSPIELIVNVDEDQEEVARKFMKYDSRSAPVVNAAGVLLGRITVDDVIDVVQEEASEDFYRMGGTHEDEELYAGRVFKVARLRLPWLLVNLLGGLISGSLLWHFKVTIKDIVVLVTFIPIIMALGGSVGQQSSTIIVRGLALGRFGSGQVLKALIRELRVALILGCSCGAGVVLVIQAWRGTLILGLVVGLSMVTSIALSGTLGSLTPLIFKRFNVDPALASGPFISSMNDIVGLSVYMGIATFFIRVFGMSSLN
ncbi:MAG: magnesium transporter [Deltaproteobacteria bacterium]|nr:magnesium transporter [Deltaproteobacteria bacterium]MBW2141248.1 magnesium transporter [Deltaproteobacteria bacterium]